MLQPSSSKYYEYAVGGKTGYTSDALATLITMADNGSMKLVCVVLRTHGGNNYPDTTNLFNYAFDNFERIDVNGQETSEDVGDILKDESGEHSGYVVVPKGVEFSDLKMEMTVDEDIPEKQCLLIPMKEILWEVPEQNSVRNISRSIGLRLRNKKRRRRKQMHRMGKIFNRV